MKKYENANPYDPNLKLHLVGCFLSEILGKKYIKVDSFDAMRQMLKHHKVLIFIDDLDHKEVLDALVGQTHWFGCGSRIIVITKDKHFLRAHGIDHIYEVCLPSDELALKMFCKSAFGKYSPKDKAIFRHIASLFNGKSVRDIKLLLADRNLDVNIGLRNLVDKALIHIRDGNIEMHSLLQKLGKEIVRALSNELGEREFLVDAKDICDLLENNIGTSKVLGIALDMDEMNELHIHKRAFEKMSNLLFLEIYTRKWNEEKRMRWNLREGFDYLPQKLIFLRFDKYPGRCMPSNFCPENLVKLELRGSKLERLWEGVQILGGLKEINLDESVYLKEIPDLSKATNLERLDLSNCSSLVELPSSIKYRNKLEDLFMFKCSSLETLPNGINLQSLNILNLGYCLRLKSFPDISTNISMLSLSQKCIGESHSNLSGENYGMNRINSETLWTRAQPYSLTRLHLSDMPSLVELPSSIKNFFKLEELVIVNCINLETLPTGINFCFLENLTFFGCSRLRIFPNISTNIERLRISHTGIEEVPWWIENFIKLKCIYMGKCNNLVRVSLNIFRLKYLEDVDFSDCGALTEASWNGIPIATDEVLPQQYLQLRFLHLDPEAILQNQSIIFKSMVLSGEEVTSYFTHQTTGYYLTNIPLRPTSLSQQLFKFKACVVVDVDSDYFVDMIFIHVCCRFKDRLGNSFLWIGQIHMFDSIRDLRLLVLNYLIPPDKCNAPLAQLNYDHVDMGLHIRGDTGFTLKRWGIHLVEESSSPMNRLSNPYKVFDEDDLVRLFEHSEECVQRVGKRQRETGSMDFWEKPFKKMFSCVRKFFSEEEEEET